MEEGYWALFCETGDVRFYLLYRFAAQEEPALTAYAEPKAELT